MHLIFSLPPRCTLLQKQTLLMILKSSLKPMSRKTKFLTVGKKVKNSERRQFITVKYTTFHDSLKPSRV
ncbi:hypothetical protein IC575_017138 [Cucumis melo]